MGSIPSTKREGIGRKKGKELEKEELEETEEPEKELEEEEKGGRDNVLRS